MTSTRNLSPIVNAQKLPEFFINCVILSRQLFHYRNETHSTVPRNPDGVDVPVVRQAPGDLKIPVLFDLIKNRIARLDGDAVLQ